MTYEILLSEQELALVIASLDTQKPDTAETEACRILAKRLNSELWLPYYQNVAIGRRPR